MKKVTILSSCGEFEIDYDTGTIISQIEDIPEEYQSIVSFDVNEHKQFHKNCCNPVEIGAIDILDIGFWYKAYSAPETEWREFMTGQDS